MKVDDWFKSDKDYAAGVAIYKKQQRSNKALWRYFDRGPSVAHENKLAYELAKYRVAPTPLEKVIKSVDKEVLRLRESKTDTYYLENLPAPIRPIRERAQIIYIEMRSLKLELNELAPHMEDAAFALQMRLWYKRKENIACWQQIDYYLANKKFLPSPVNDVENMSPARLLQVGNNMRSQISNHRKTVEKNEELLKTATETAQIAKYERAINKSNDLILTKNTILTAIENKIYIHG